MQGWKNFQPFLLPLNYGKISKIRFGRKKYFLLVFKKYFEQKFQKLFLKNHSYEVFDIENLQNIPEIFKTENLVGLNVTIPYKEQIIPYLDELSEEAQEIGAINCISIKKGKTKGFNTDALGFEKTLLLHKKLHQLS